MFFKKKKSLPPEIENLYKKIDAAFFPNGENDRKIKAKEIHAITKGKLSEKESMQVLLKAAALMVIAKDKNPSRITGSILKDTNNKIAESEALEIYNLLLETLSTNFFSHE